MSDTVTANVTTRLGRRRPQRGDKRLPAAFAPKMAALNIHEQVSLRGGVSILETIGGSIRIVQRCRMHRRESVLAQRYGRNKLPVHYCSTCVAQGFHSRQKKHPTWQVLPRIVLLSDELWTALEVAFGVLASMGSSR